MQSRPPNLRGPRQVLWPFPRTIRPVRPATAVVILVLLAAIAVAGLVQLWVLFSPPG